MISTEEIDKLATLARIHLTEEEKVSYAKDIENILEYFKNLNEINFEEKDFQKRNTNVLREDVEREVISNRESLLNSAKNRDGDYISVKEIFE